MSSYEPEIVSLNQSATAESILKINTFSPDESSTNDSLHYCEGIDKAELGWSFHIGFRLFLKDPPISFVLCLSRNNAVIQYQKPTLLGELCTQLFEREHLFLRFCTYRLILDNCFHLCGVSQPYLYSNLLSSILLYLQIIMRIRIEKAKNKLAKLSAIDRVNRSLKVLLESNNFCYEEDSYHHSKSVKVLSNKSNLNLNSARSTTSKDSRKTSWFTRKNNTIDQSQLGNSNTKSTNQKNSELVTDQTVKHQVSASDISKTVQSPPDIPPKVPKSIARPAGSIFKYWLTGNSSHPSDGVKVNSNIKNSKINDGNYSLSNSLINDSKDPQKLITFTPPVESSPDYQSATKLEASNSSTDRGDTDVLRFDGSHSEPVESLDSSRLPFDEINHNYYEERYKIDLANERLRTPSNTTEDMENDSAWRTVSHSAKNQDIELIFCGKSGTNSRVSVPTTDDAPVSHAAQQNDIDSKVIKLLTSESVGSLSAHAVNGTTKYDNIESNNYFGRNNSILLPASIQEKTEAEVVPSVFNPHDFFNFEFSDLSIESRAMYVDGAYSHMFKLRGANYLVDQKKDDPGPAMCKLMLMELYRVDTSKDGDRHDHVVSRGLARKRLQVIRSLPGNPLVFVVNFQIPGDPPVSIVCYFALPPDLLERFPGPETENFLKLFKEYLNLPITEVERLKLWGQKTKTQSMPPTRRNSLQSLQSDVSLMHDTKSEISDPFDNSIPVMPSVARVTVSEPEPETFTAPKLVNAPALVTALEPAPVTTLNGGSWVVKLPSDTTWPDGSGPGEYPQSDFRNMRLKLIPTVTEGPWVVKAAVRPKPAMLGRKVVQRYFAGDGYIETDVHVGSSVIASQVVGLCRGYAKNFSADIAFVIQADSPEELPERLLGCVSVNRVNIDLACNLDSI